MQNNMFKRIKIIMGKQKDTEIFQFIIEFSKYKQLYKKNIFSIHILLLYNYIKSFFFEFEVLKVVHNLENINKNNYLL